MHFIDDFCILSAKNFFHSDGEYTFGHGNYFLVLIAFLKNNG